MSLTPAQQQLHDDLISATRQGDRETAWRLRHTASAADCAAVKSVIEEELEREWTS
jgi:hypothetical protein